MNPFLLRILPGRGAVARLSGWPQHCSVIKHIARGTCLGGILPDSNAINRMIPRKDTGMHNKKWRGAIFLITDP